MKIKHIVETAKGALEYTAELTSDQVKFLVEVGINHLLKNGVDLFNMNKTPITVPVSGTIQ